MLRPLASLRQPERHHHRTQWPAAPDGPCTVETSDAPHQDTTRSPAGRRHV